MPVFSTTTTANAVSLTIDVVNKEAMPALTASRFVNGMPGALRSLNGDRLRGDFGKADAVWGFRETCLSSDFRYSNAVGLADQKLLLYVAPLGHGAGKLAFSEEPVFAYTTLQLTWFDVVNGTSEDFFFDNFETPADDLSRFVSLNIPSYDYIQGIHGLYVLRVRESNAYYQTADRTVTLDVDPLLASKNNESFLQIITFWTNEILNEVVFNPSQVGWYGDAKILSDVQNNPVNNNDTLVKIFDDRSRFPDYLPSSAGNPVDISPSEKEAIILDNTLAALSTQMPILPADCPLSPLLGVGITESGDVSQSPIVPIVRANPPLVVSPEKLPRLFSLVGIAPATNLLADLNELTDDHDQLLTSVLRDPLRCWIVQLDESATVGFSLTGSKASGLEAPVQISGSPVTITIDDDAPVMGDISITLDNNNPKRPIRQVSVSFQVLSGAGKIARVSYALAVDDEAYVTFMHPDQSARQFTFEPSWLSKAITNASVLRARIGIEDLRGQVRFYKAVKPLSVIRYLQNVGWNKCGTPSILNTQIRHSASEPGVVELTYDLVDISESSTATVLLTVNGEEVEAIGDIGENIRPGAGKLIIFRSPCQGKIQMALTAVNSGNLSAVGDLSAAAVIDSFVDKPYVSFAPALTDRFGIFDGVDLEELELSVQTGIRAYRNSSSSEGSGESSNDTLSSKSSKSSSSGSSHSSSFTSFSRLTSSSDSSPISESSDSSDSSTTSSSYSTFSESSNSSISSTSSSSTPLCSTSSTSSTSSPPSSSSSTSSSSTSSTSSSSSSSTSSTSSSSTSSSSTSSTSSSSTSSTSSSSTSSSSTSSTSSSSTSSTSSSSTSSTSSSSSSSSSSPSSRSSPSSLSSSS